MTVRSPGACIIRGRIKPVEKARRKKAPGEGRRRESRASLQGKVRAVRQMPKKWAVAAPAGAAADLRAVCGDEGVTLQPMGRAVIPTGIAVELPGPEYVALVFARSGLAVKNGLTLSNGVGVIDSDYRGEISVGLVNLSDKPYTVQNGERIAQLAVMPVALPDMLEVETLTDTERGTGGFGSTGRQ